MDILKKLSKVSVKERRLEDEMIASIDKLYADVDYIAMMEDIDLGDDDEPILESTEEEEEADD